MSNITRWSPFSEFEDMMNRYNRMLGVARTNGDREGKDLFSRSDWAPAVDIKETPEAFTVEAELPGMNKEDVKVTVHDGVLTIQGGRQTAKAGLSPGFCSFYPSGTFQSAGIIIAAAVP
ncbi:Hsp20/alpha crystallin family protein [Marinobacter sp. SS5-14b]|uniref:Hsp20/alpha crystallin family protein n=1 Tax=Marinobacter sp. SS5-14b TaxID=3050456 RepID=UPI0026DEF66C|nr:Hsp20/alpha crystallin family protein [Marinobacter sp. SS5-14b]